MVKLDRLGAGEPSATGHQGFSMRSAKGMVGEGHGERESGLLAFPMAV
jgi:hypothetical protein